MSETPVPIPHVPSGPSATSLQNASASHRAGAAPSSIPSAASTQPGQLGHSAQPGAAPPQTPQSQSGSLPAQTPTYVPASASPPKTTPKSTLKALPTVRDHTTDQLGPGGDEYLPREIDEAGEKKVMPNGQLLGGRQYRCRTFLVPHRGDKLFMLATECARVLSYRDSYLLFNKNRSLYKIIASQVEKDDLVAQEILPFSYRSRQIAIVTARSMFRQFGSRMIEGGRRVRDDYWETKARKQGFTEADPAGEKRPGASKARAEAVEASQAAPALLGGPHGEIIYNNAPAQFGAPHPNLMPGMIGSPAAGSTRMPMITTVGPDYTENRSNRGEYAAILKTGPRQEITGPAYQDRTQPTAMPEIHAQAHHAAEFNRSVNQQRDMRNDYMQTMWRRPHEQPASASLSQPVGTDASVPASRPAPSAHTAAGMQQSGIVPNQSPQMLMTAAPYSQSIHAQNPVNASSISRGMSPPFLTSPPKTTARPTRVYFQERAAACHRVRRTTTTSKARFGLPRLRLRSMVTRPIRPSLSSPATPSSLRLLSRCDTPAPEVKLVRAACHIRACPVWGRATVRRARACTQLTRLPADICTRVPPPHRRSRRPGPSSRLLVSGGRINLSSSRRS